MVFIHSQKCRVDLAKSFSVWKFSYIDGKREVCVCVLLEINYAYMIIVYSFLIKN